MKYSKGFLIISIGLNILLGIYLLKGKGIIKNSQQKQVTKSSTADKSLFEEINPEKGYEIATIYGSLGPDMIKMGVLDLEKFKSQFEQSGNKLTQEQLNILTQGSNKKIKITPENSYFLLDFFWAVGLVNQTRILTEGDMIKNSQGQVGNFASTGGWSLAQGDPMDYYAKGNLIPMTKEQEDLVEKVASNIYRPCCNNSTAFPDCNHGMALLGVLELMSSSGATEREMYEAAKYFNAFWFPGNYYDIALYFKNKENKKFNQIPGQVILGKEYSSATGWRNTKQWLISKGIVEEPPKQGGGCGI